MEKTFNYDFKIGDNVIVNDCGKIKICPIIGIYYCVATDSTLYDVQGSVQLFKGEDILNLDDLPEYKELKCELAELNINYAKLEKDYATAQDRIGTLTNQNRILIKRFKESEEHIRSLKSRIDGLIKDIQGTEAQCEKLLEENKALKENMSVLDLLNKTTYFSDF